MVQAGTKRFMRVRTMRQFLRSRATNQARVDPRLSVISTLHEGVTKDWGRGRVQGRKEQWLSESRSVDGVNDKAQVRMPEGTMFGNDGPRVAQVSGSAGRLCPTGLGGSARCLISARSTNRQNRFVRERAPIHGVCGCSVITIPTSTSPGSASWPNQTMLLCYLITRMPEQLHTIRSLQQVLVLPRNRSIPSLHRWHPPSAIHFSRTSCAPHSALGCSLMKTKNRFRQSGRRSFQRRPRHAIQPRPRLMRSLNRMRLLPARSRQNVQKLRKR